MEWNPSLPSVARHAAGLHVTTAIPCFLLVIGSAIGILNLEEGAAVKVHTASDALWWSFEMLISQGSGLYNPVTMEGRLLATALSITGFVLMGALVGGISASILGEEEEKIEREESEILRQVGQIHERLTAIEKRLDRGPPASEPEATNSPASPGRLWRWQRLALDQNRRGQIGHTEPLRNRRAAA